MKLELLDYQHQFFSSKSPLTCLLTGLGVGKTFILAARTVVNALTMPGRGMVVAGTATQLKMTLFQTLLENADAFGVTPIHKPSNKEILFAVPQPSGKPRRYACWTGSAEQGNSLRGPNLPWVCGDELRTWDRENFNVILGRVRAGAAPQAWFTSTPDELGWIWDFWQDQPVNNPALAATRRMIGNVPTWANPHLPEVYLRQLADSYDATTYAREVEGRGVVAVERIVYSQFSRARNVAGRPERWADFDPALPVGFSFDFNVLGHALIYQHHRGELFAVDEVVAPGAITAELAAECVRRYWTNQPRKPPQVILTGDATGHRRTATSRTSDWETVRGVLQDERVPVDFIVSSANPSVADRVTLMNGALKNHRGESRLWIHPRCATLIRDMEQVSYREGTRALDGTNKKLTHISDAAGYALAALYPLPARGVA